jgi:hypothetical protein
MGPKGLDILGISWIDKRPLPQTGFWFVAGAIGSWPRRVALGLVATANPTPPTTIPDASAFARTQQYRALLSCRVNEPFGKPRRLQSQQLSAGFTPPFDKSVVAAIERIGLPAATSDQSFYEGEASPVSGFILGKRHPVSTLDIPSDASVVVSALVKFRAGEHTDSIGVSSDVGSPVHVPWVWCEYTLFVRQSRLYLACRGSKFPSHAWYVDGKQVAIAMQTTVAADKNDPILQTGQPAAHKRDVAAADKSSGPVDTHANAVSWGEQQVVALSVTR